MAYTALGALQPDQKKAWVKESIRVFRENFFFNKFLGTTENSIVQHVTELKRTEKGDRAMIGLVADLQGTGVVGDNDINGRYEALESSWVEIHTDQLRNGVKSKGRVDDQRSVFDFRKEARDKLAFWRANSGCRRAGRDRRGRRHERSGRPHRRDHRAGVGEVKLH